MKLASKILCIAALSAAGAQFAGPAAAQNPNSCGHVAGGAVCGVIGGVEEVVTFYESKQ